MVRHKTLRHKTLRHKTLRHKTLRHKSVRFKTVIRLHSGTLLNGVFQNSAALQCGTWFKTEHYSTVQLQNGTFQSGTVS